MKTKQAFLFVLSLCGSFLLLIGSLNVYAADSKEYESRTGVGFYGSYEYPEENSSSEEVSSDTIDDSSKVISDSGIVPANNDHSQLGSKPSKIFPNTGESSNRYIGLIGIFILVIILLIILINKKKKTKGNMK
ncbi:hypothetical protein IGL98_002955 [Enterococcus sp. DIV0840]|uniref:LPXTG cell wall anchor domain-containing protein n=1 Tax=Enterococcus TaxID=1350 RepID=UPI001A904DFF|nr:MULTISPECIES: LPXTG cell wall anchor domain-containing protein [Enterococcus]MBO0435787.1 LPXTG cell wall anchor domain-containing protein [Enterococcus sp. DIV0849a]MBO0472276.1 LPXTG cell wall anchor domain-containing protein [Enterococcus ureasiticus]